MARVTTPKSSTTGDPKSETFEDSYQRLLSSPPPPELNPLLAKYWKKKVFALCDIGSTVMLDSVMERHRIFSRLLMALVYHYWNGYKKGRPEGPRGGTYPWNDLPKHDDPDAYNGSYLGHNIAALAVDEYGRILDFDFNHIELFDSAAEHAEARLVRRLFSLANVHETWNAWPQISQPTDLRVVIERDSGGDKTNTPAQSLGHITMYTTLEPCAQCAGIMAHAQIKEVVYLQTDPGAAFMSRILFNLVQTERMKAPRPIAGSEIGLECFRLLDEAYADFYVRVATKAFWRPRRGTADHSNSLTSFLCTSRARAIFRKFGRLPTAAEVADAKNRELLSGVNAFFGYATTKGRRATPHNL